MEEVIINGERAVWITGYTNAYRVTESGKVLKYYKTVDVPKVLTPAVVDGYDSYRLHHKDSSKYVTAHRLVALHFVGNPNNYTQVDHIDENKANNHYTNLRWCTPAENREYYERNSAADYRTKLNAERKAKLLTLERQLREKSKQIAALEKELQHKELQLARAEEALHRKLEQELQRTPTKYDGYAGTKNITFESVDAMVEIVGKPITINGALFRSCAAAANHIIKEELKLGYLRNQGTVSKELRRYLQGYKPSWSMYGRYLVQ